MLTVLAEKGNESSLAVLFHKATHGDLIDINIASRGKRRVRPEELKMQQLRKGFKVKLNPVLTRNIEKSRYILGQLVANGEELVGEFDVKCPCCKKAIKLRENGNLNNLRNHLRRRVVLKPTDDSKELLTKLESLMAK